MKLMQRLTDPEPSEAPPTTWACYDGNEAAARVAYRLSEVISLYPITPASSMGELSDAWSAAGVPNLWGSVPEVIEMQSEAGAAGTIHGALLGGSLATTFTASQGLLLMIPNMFKIAGELTPAVIHVAARTIATHALSIFGDHSDVMAARSTGWAMLCSSSVQEAQDLALVAHVATLESRVPFLHFFDGFRTSHELNKIEELSEADMRALVDDRTVTAHRARGLTPDAPVLRGSAQNPDVFFQAREASNPYYDVLPSIVQDAMDRLASRTGRAYELVEYSGAEDAERVIVMMGSGVGAAEEAVERMCADGEKVGLLKIRLFRPFPSDALIDALPASARKVAVLDRTKEPGAAGEPLYQDVLTALAEAERPATVVGGRYGLSSKEFTPAMVKAVFDMLSSEPKRHFTVGIVDDVTHLSLDHDPSFRTEPAGVRAQFYGLGSDGSVGAAKNTVKILAEETELNAQGYFVYDSKKSGSTTGSHVRVSPEPIRSTYLIQEADFVVCSQFSLLRRLDVLKDAGHGAKVLLNAPFPADKVWGQLPETVRAQIVDRDLDLWVVDANAVANGIGLGQRINTIMQSCFFELSGVLPGAVAIAAMKRAVDKTYAKRGQVVVERNQQAVDLALQALVHVVHGPRPILDIEGSLHAVSSLEDDFVARVTKKILAGEGDLLPVSALPVDGTFPTGTAAIEKRGIASTIPIWDPSICIDCGHCAIVCPHAAIRMNVYDPGALDGAPQDFKSKDFHAKDVPGMKLTIQVAPLDCTGCGICVDVCPAKSKSEVKHKAINMQPIEEHLVAEESAWSFFENLPTLDPTMMDPGTVKGSQVRKPLFEFSGACAGCGETPYLKLLTQLFGDHTLVANATGCSSIYGGNLPTTPWAKDEHGRGPAWANSLFEDNAEFGLGIRLGLDQRVAEAQRLLAEIEPELTAAILENPQTDIAGIEEQRRHVSQLKDRLSQRVTDDRARRLTEIADALVKKSVWIVGGDGWAYDIGSGGLDHVLASGRNVNVLVLDTEVYSNTGGQASKATPRGAIAKFAARGKKTVKKDLGLIAAAYGDVYVAQVALGANYNQTIKAFVEAEAWEGPSLIIAYSTCIAHGIDMATSMTHQKDAVKTGYWPLFRFHPGTEEHEQPFMLDSAAPSLPLRSFTSKEGRFAMLERGEPDAANILLEVSQGDVDEKRRLYEQMAGVERKMTAGGKERGDG
jgi:pyruvate-ferredoxin/flavodoxin oxidoreductase